MHAWYADVHALTLALVRIPSLTNSAGESDFAAKLADLLAAWPYFQRQPTQLRRLSTLNDLHQRENLFALVRGATPQTIVLAGHYDVVSIENYGALQPWAYDPEALLPRLIAELEQHAQPADAQALADLKSGDFLPGRGALDMKSGLAAGLAVLRHAALQAEPLRYNLLFVATPDEEQASHGMRSSVQQLPLLAAEWGLALVAAINLDSGVDVGDGGQGQTVFMGSVGKLLPAVYVVGRETHAGAPFTGVNATLMAAAITQRIECNVALTDTVAGETSPPPVCLKQIDLKNYYDVTTPTAAWCYYNLLSHGRSASAALQLFANEVRAAMAETLAMLRERASQYSAHIGRSVTLPEMKPLLLTFAQLYEQAQQRNATAVAIALAAVQQAFATDPTIDLPLYSSKVFAALWQCSGLTGPAAIVGFASVHYPAAHVGATTAGERQLRQVIERQAVAVARDFNTPVTLHPFFPGISDMSFLGGNLPAADAALVNANTPTRPVVAEGGLPITSLNLPAVNIGPWGRDYHRRAERVYMPYSFTVVPELIWRIVNDL
ncbi:MAG: M20/M25/M40 family metallo-hydrolase [Chloroflexi bacterium]|nr:M20/M25/M40 family metallo-hydrolase [Chloroflexota bacterium]